MADPHTADLYRQLHEDRAARLLASMQRPATFATRHAVGSLLVSLGLRLAPDVHPRSRGQLDLEPASPPQRRVPRTASPPDAPASSSSCRYPSFELHRQGDA